MATPRFSSREEYFAWKNGQQPTSSAQPPGTYEPASGPSRLSTAKPMAKKSEWGVLPRLLACAGITAGVWIVLIAFGLAFASVQK